MTNKQVVIHCKTITNSSSKDRELSHTQIYKILLSGRFLGRLFEPLLIVDLPLMKNVLRLFAKSILIPVGLTTQAPTANAVIHKNILPSGTLVISSKEIKDIMKIVKDFEDAGLLLKVVTKSNYNKTK